MIDARPAGRLYVEHPVRKPGEPPLAHQNSVTFAIPGAGGVLLQGSFENKCRSILKLLCYKYTLL